ncbi:MAG: MFS transporter [Burkholderiaceae bacterium]
MSAVISAPPAPSPASSAVVTLQQDAKVMGLVGLAHASSHFAHMLLSPLFPLFIIDFGLSFTELGLLTSVFFLVSGVGQSLAGFVVDRIGARPVLFASFGLFVLACIVAATAQGYSGLMAVAVLAGLGNASFHPVDFTILNQRVSAPRLGYAFSVHGITGNLGWALASAFFVGMATWTHWRTAYWAAAALMLAVLALLFVHRDRLSTEVNARKPLVPGEGKVAAKPESDLAYLKLPVIWWCFGFFMLSTMTLAVIQTYSASILQALYGISLQQAALTVTAYMVSGAVGMLVGGFVAARMAAASDHVVAVCMTVGALCLMLCATGWLGTAATLMVLAATGFAVGIGGPSRDMMIKKATPKGATGRVYGTVYSGLDVGFALSPLLFGALMDKGYFAATLGVAGLVLLLAVVAALGVGRRIKA